MFAVYAIFRGCSPQCVDSVLFWLVKGQNSGEILHIILPSAIHIQYLDGYMYTMSRGGSLFYQELSFTVVNQPIQCLLKFITVILHYLVLSVSDLTFFLSLPSGVTTMAAAKPLLQVIT